MSDTPAYLVTARAVNPLARCIDDLERGPHRRDLSPFIVRCSELRTPATYRREWFDYVRESGNDLA
jgi:hypothetical protein